MSRLFGWLKAFIQAKVNVFFKGFSAGSIIAGLFLFGSNIHSTTIILYNYLIKVLAVLITGFISGFTTVLGNDIYHWSKSKFVNKKVSRNNKKNKKVA